MEKSLNSFDINLIKDKKILIGTPTYENHVMINYHHSIMALQEIAILNKINIKYILGTHDALIPRMRNNIVKHFIENDYDYLMFIDSDISFVPEDVLYMIYLSETTDMKVMVGAYPKKEIVWSQIQKAIDNGLIKNSEDIKKYSSEFGIRFKNNAFFDPNKPFEIEHGSTGFMLISKQVIIDFFINYSEKIGKDYDGNTIYVCFESVIDQETKNFLSEDYFFCNMLKKIGYKVWLIPSINLNHLGSTTFSGNFIDFLKNN
jgi:hypothetical protein